jgi:hypothetical protein
MAVVVLNLENYELWVDISLKPLGSTIDLWVMRPKVGISSTYKTRVALEEPYEQG